jgi:Kef-type K+ transport system membrane component KefB
MALFFALAAAFGLWALPRLVRWVRELPVSQSVLTLAIVTLLGYALAAELIGGMAAITGAFLAGLMFARSPERDALEPRISALAYGFFVPIFFVSIGLSVDIASVKAGLGLAAVVIIVAILGKLLGSGLGAKWAGFSWREAWQLGAGMVSRGEVGLIVASVGAQAGLVNEAEFAAIVGMVIVSTLVTPPVLRALFKEPKVSKVPDEPKESIV